MSYRRRRGYIGSESASSSSAGQENPPQILSPEQRRVESREQELGAPQGQQAREGLAVAQAAGPARRLPSDDELLTLPAKYKENKTGSVTVDGTIKLVCNYVRMNGTWDSFLVLYDVQFAPDEPNRVNRREYVKKVMEQERVGPLAHVYNGRNLLFLRGADAARISEASKSFARGEISVKCTVRRARVIKGDDFEIMQFLNNLKNRWMEVELRMSMLGRAHFDHTKKTRISEGYHQLTLIPGFSTAIALHDGGVLLNIDNRFKVIREINVLKLITDMMRGSRSGTEQARADVTDAIVGSIVITQYADKARTYRILDIDWNANPGKIFDIKGNRITLEKYYADKYKIKIQDPRQPLLLAEETGAARFKVAGQERHVNLIPELCQPTGLTDEMRENFRLMKKVSEVTLQDPGKRINETYDLMERLLGNPTVTNFTKSWKLEFDNDLAEINARVLPSVGLRQGPKTFSYKPDNADWTRDIRSSRFHLLFSQPKKVILAFPRNYDGGAKAFWAMLRQVGGPLGMNLPDPTILPYERDNEIVGQLRKLCMPKDVSLAIVILAVKTKGRYDDIKQLLCRDLPVVSQCVVQKTLDRPGQLMSVATKIALQMGSKMGGAPWSLDLNRFGPAGSDIMYVGVDTYHDSRHKGGSRSAVAIVATRDAASTQYSHRVFFQDARAEIGENLGKAVEALLDDYRSANNEKMPGKVVFYRDGVGIGQLPVVFRSEVDSVLKAIRKKAPGTKLAFCVVTKRHNTRFIVPGPMGPSGRIVERSTNPIPGTVVDTVCTKPNRMDFYIIPQTVRQGTVCPTYYNTLYDDTSLTVDQLQQLTYAQCTMYFNWSGTIKVPAPCQYAHKLAFLVGQSIHDTPAHELNKQVYFL